MTALMLAMGTFALMGAITPGPVNVLAIRHGAAAGRLTALAYVLGASLSYALVVWPLKHHRAPCRMPSAAHRATAATKDWIVATWPA